MLNIKRLSSISNVGPGQQTTIEVPVGIKSYESFGLELGGITFTKAQAKAISVEIGGKPIQRFKDGVQLDLINAYYGRKIRAGELMLHFYRPEFIDAKQSAFLDLGMSDVPVCQVRMDIDGAAVAPTLAGYARQWQFSGKNRNELIAANALGAFTKVRHFTYSPNGAGLFEIDNIPREGFAQAIHLICKDGDNIKSARVQADGVDVWEETTKERMASIVEYSGRTRQANTYHIDWMLKNEFGGQFPLVGLSDFRLILDIAGADTIDVYVEYLSGYAGV